jgi:hypothetical protein
MSSRACLTIQPSGSPSLMPWNWRAGISVTDLEIFSEMLPEIEHLANTKYDASRIEESGIVIGAPDLLRYGLHALRAPMFCG